MATAPVPSTAAMTIARRYPVARERAFKADIESTARKIPVIGKDGTSKSVCFPTDPARDRPLRKRASSIADGSLVILRPAARVGVSYDAAGEDSSRKRSFEGSLSEALGSEDGGLGYGRGEGGSRWWRETTVGTEEGLHARPAKQFVQKAKQFGSEIKVIKGKREANAKSPIKLMTLGAKKDEKITIRAEGDDAEEAVDALVELVSKSEL